MIFVGGGAAGIEPALPDAGATSGVITTILRSRSKSVEAETHGFDLMKELCLVELGWWN